MIDSKKIEEAAKQHAAGAFISEYWQACYKEGFMTCAKWMQEEFLKDLWHPDCEEPNHESTRTYILGKTKASESGVLPMLLRPNTNWKEFVVSHGVTYWLYVDDLFPKEGGEQ